MDGPVPRLGENVPRWYGETIGFWDNDTLITWTSNIQAWASHTAFEHSNQMQSIEIYTPLRDAQRRVHGLNHEAILYDPEALVEPIRIIQRLMKLAEFDDAEVNPDRVHRMHPDDLPGRGHGDAADARAGQFEFEVPDMYGRPVGADLGEVLGTRHEEARRGRPVRFQRPTPDK